MDRVFSCRTDAFFPGVHKIGAAISRPQNCGHEFYGHEDFSEIWWAWRQQQHHHQQHSYSTAGKDEDDEDDEKEHPAHQQQQQSAAARPVDLRRGDSSGMRATPIDYSKWDHIGEEEEEDEADKDDQEENEDDEADDEVESEIDSSEIDSNQSAVADDYWGDYGYAEDFGDELHAEAEVGNGMEPDDEEAGKLDEANEEEQSENVHEANRERAIAALAAASIALQEAFRCAPQEREALPECMQQRVMNVFAEQENSVTTQLAHYSELIRGMNASEFTQEGTEQLLHLISSWHDDLVAGVQAMTSPG